MTDDNGTIPPHPPSAYGEPWSQRFGCIYVAGGYPANTSKERKRTIACVNACAGIAHPEKLPALLEAIAMWRLGDGTGSGAAIEQAMDALGWSEP
jgi:hypothetical protein